MNSTCELGDDAARVLKPYPAYKDSGIEWLGDVPEHWEVLRLKQICRLAYGDALADAVRRDGAVPVLGSNGRVGFHDSANTKEPCIVIGRKGSFGKVNYSPDSAFAIDTTFFVDSRFSSANIRWLFFLLRWLRLDEVTRDSAVPGLDREDTYQRPGVLPPLSEQAAIVRFLDHADRRIRRHIQAKEQLIALLEEQKRAVIHEAVTGRIDVRTGRRYAAYRPSGVEWLGEVPKQWTSTRLKVVLSRPIQNGIFKKKDQFGAGAPLINVANVYGEHFRVEPASLERVQASPDEVRRFQVQAGDLFFVRSSLKLEGTGRSAVATECSSDTVFECHLVQARPDTGRINPRYLVFQLNSYAHRHHLISRANVVTMATVAQDTISSCPVVVPPRREQDLIVEWIDAQWRRLSQVVEGANREISLLREYRVRLIADGVTGKLDLREAAAETPDKSDGSNWGEGINAAEHCDPVEAG